jgi:hypothetical protein
MCDGSLEPTMISNAFNLWREGILSIQDDHASRRAAPSSSNEPVDVCDQIVIGKKVRNPWIVGKDCLARLIVNSGFVYGYQVHTMTPFC